MKSAKEREGEIIEMKKAPLLHRAALKMIAGTTTATFRVLGGSKAKSDFFGRCLAVSEIFIKKKTTLSNRMDQRWILYFLVATNQKQTK